MKYKLLVILMVGFNVLLNGMDAVKRKIRKERKEEIEITRVDDSPSMQGRRFIREMPDRDVVNLMRTQKTLEEIADELGLTEEEVMQTPVAWFHPNKKRDEGNPDIIWKTIDVISQVREPISNQIGVYEDHYKNCIRWRWLSRLILPWLPAKLKNNFEKEADKLMISISLTEYLEWRTYRGILYKQNALEELPKITQKVSDTYSRQTGFKKIVSFIAASISIVSGIKLLMSSDSTNKCIGGAAVGAGLWHWHYFYTKK